MIAIIQSRTGKRKGHAEAEMLKLMPGHIE